MSDTSVKPVGWLYSIDEMTRTKILELDGQKYPPVWLSHSWLSMMSYCLDGTPVGEARYAFCEHLWNMKEVMRDEGYDFRIDDLC